MSLVKYNSSFFRPTFNSVIDRFFDDAAFDGGVFKNFSPKVDIAETEGSFEIQVAVPGMEKENFKLELNDSVLTISGERKFENEKKEKNFHSVETQYGSFSRSFHLPKDVDGENIAAEYKNGILNVVLPKDQKKIEKTSIEVK